MKKLSLLCLYLFASYCIYSQSHSLKAGTLKPVNNKGITILPTTKDEATAAISLAQPSSNKIVLVGGSMNPSEGGNEILTNSSKNNGLVNFLDNNSTNRPKISTTNTIDKNTKNRYDFAPLTDENILISKSTANTQIQTARPTLEPLTYSSSINNINKQAPVETLDPSRINSNKPFVQQVAQNKNKPVYVSSLKSNPQETVGPRTQGSSNQLKMIELLPIIQDNTIAGGSSSKASTFKQNNGMPDLAPIEGIEVKNVSKSITPVSSMPELAPLENENNDQEQTLPTEQIEVNNKKINNKIRGYKLPKGTLLKANDKKVYIVKPAVPVKTQEGDEILQYGKPSAGGGMGLIFMDEDENKSSSLSENFQTNPQLQQAAKNHPHDPNNPCCKVQIMTTTAKPGAKKIVYKRKKKYQPNPNTTLRTYRQDSVQTKNVERIVYLPVQSEQQIVPKSNKKKEVQFSTQKQPSFQPKERVVYRDYTNAYTKKTNTQNTQQGATPKDPKTYYNPNNYANGLNAGPTSGDYPISGKTSDVNMQYTFYVDPRGKYGISLYNNNCSILLSQNGKVVEFKEYGDTKGKQPNLNYFGSPESIGGIPIEYNYNRSVHKIGNIEMDYDFEGFFKTVGKSNVSYTSRSSLSKVDNINVRYDGAGNVTSVDNNDGLIQYNP